MLIANGLLFGSNLRCHTEYLCSTLESMNQYTVRNVYQDDVKLFSASFLFLSLNTVSLELSTQYFSISIALLS